MLAEFLACLEDDDRQPGVIQANWADLWRRLNRPSDPPDLAPLLDTLTATALIQPELPPLSDGVPPTASVPPAAHCRMHPGVAAAIAAAADPGIREAADAVLGGFWRAVTGQAREREGGKDSGLIVRAGLAAAPYLLRRRDWETARTLLEHATVGDVSPGLIAAAVPALRRIAAATGAPVDQAVLARALRAVDPAGAGRLLRETLARAAGSGDDRLASAVAGELVTVLRDGGWLAEALEMAGQKARYTRSAGLGPWTQLLDEGQRLQILSLMGEHEQVLDQTRVLRGQMTQLPARPDATETVAPWNVRELILGTGRSSALALGRWELCLELNAEITASTRRRGAGEHELARTRVNDAFPLLRLGRLVKVRRLLRHCQQVFEGHRDTAMLALVLGTRADLEAGLRRGRAAVDLARAALRLGYARPDPRSLAVSHHNLAVYLGAAGGVRAERRAHRLAAALLYRLAGMAYDLADTVRVLAGELAEDAGIVRLPSTLTEVVVVAERTDGVRLGELLATLEPDPAAIEAALAEILRAAAAPPRDDP